MAALVPFLMFFVGLLIGGIVALQHEHSYPLGIGMLIIAALLAFFFLNISNIKRRYAFTIGQCPEKGKPPQWGSARRGYRWYSCPADRLRAKGDCTFCGYHTVINISLDAYTAGSADPSLIPLHP